MCSSFPAREQALKYQFPAIPALKLTRERTRGDLRGYSNMVR